MSINFLKDASYIRNYSLCRYDTNAGYSTNFNQNGDVDGWDVYNNIFMYGSWNGVLFGSTYSKECYIGRSSVFLSLPADEYYHVEFIMKVVDESPNKTVTSLTKGKIAWKRVGDPDWSTDRELEFDINETEVWKYYRLNLGPERWWQGDINDLRFYPFIDARENDKFFIKYLRIVSENKYMCTNTQCSYYQDYSHPCLGTGSAGYCETITPKKLHTTISGSSDGFIINIDDYGDESFDVGTNINIEGKDLAKLLGNSISTLNVGGYSFVNVYYTDDEKIRISSGTNGSDSSVVIPYSEASVELGFYNNDGTPTYTASTGTDVATGFDYASTKQLATYELNKIVDSSHSVAYTHNPTQYSVEGGRRDFNEVGASELISEFEDELGFESFENLGKTIIDLSHRIDNNGRLKHFWIYGRLHAGGKLKILRPHNDGSFTVVESLEIYTETADRVYTTKPIVYRVDCDLLVKKGDLLGVYNVDMYVGKTMTNLPDATFCQYSGDITGRIEKTKIYSYGIGGFSMYSRGDLAQNNTILEIDMGYRVNISEFRIFGEEKSSYFEFNIVSCLDVSWSVNLYSKSHNHSGYYVLSGDGWSTTHSNVAHGIECLGDGVLTADNGMQGDSYDSSNGLATYGDHAYFYVNGDAEWLYSNDCSDPAEFCGNTYPYGTTGFTTDPVEFTLTFPNDKQFDIFKYVMYFKEEDNFKSFESSYYVDTYYTHGNASNAPNYNRIPNYEKVVIDGDEFREGDDNNVDLYLFKNPVKADLTNYTDQDEAAVFVASRFVKWSILGYEFASVLCKGFRLYCTNHNSTKMTELELYSKVSNDASLVDNVLLQYSDYGDVWRTSGFETIDGGVKAFIGGTPRYLLLSFESQAEFFINEIDVTITDQTYIEDNAVILLDDAKQNEIGGSKSVDLINTYNKAFDLIVDIPRSLDLSDNIVYHNNLTQDSDISNAIIGPGSVLYKSNDFPITAYHGQCAINTKSYGLKNLLHDKHAYYSTNDKDWFYHSQLTHGNSVDYYNIGYQGMYKHIINITPISAKYIKLCCLTAGGPFIVKDVLVYNSETFLQIDQLYENENCNTSVLSDIYVSGDLLFSQNNTIGIELHDSYAFDKIVLILDSDSSLDTRSYVSTDNLMYFIHEDISSSVETYYIRFVIDLENRHNIDFIRSYGPNAEGTGLISEDTKVVDYAQCKYFNSTSYGQEVYIVYSMYLGVDDVHLVFIKSTDKGATWKESTKVIIDPYIGTNSAPAMNIVALTDKKIFVVYQTNTTPRVKILYTFDGGVNWTAGPATDGTEYPVIDKATNFFDISSNKMYFIFELISGGNNTIYLKERLLPTVVGEDLSSGWTRNSIATPDHQCPNIKVFDDDNLITSYNDIGYPNDYVRTKRKVLGVWEAESTALTFGGVTNSVTYSILDAKDMDTIYVLALGPTWLISIQFAYTTNGGSSWSGQQIDYATGLSYAHLSYADGVLYHSYSDVPSDILYINKSTNNGSTWTSEHSISSGGISSNTHSKVQAIDANGYMVIHNNDSSYLRVYRDVEYNYERIPVTIFNNSSFSNSVGNIEDVVFDSDNSDCRWLRINIDCSSVIPQGVSKLGIYPDISQIYCLGGGHNHLWDDLGTVFSSYYSPVNVAYGADTTNTTTYFSDYYPNNAVDGVSSDHRTNACWAYERGSSPVLSIDFGDIHLINKIVLHGGYNPVAIDAVNNAYTFSVDPTSSGTYTQVLHKAGITTNKTLEYEFDPVYARRIKLSIDDFDDIKVYSRDEDDQIEIHNVGFFRELEIYTYQDSGNISSEDYPIVCMDLNNRFNVVDHDLINDTNDTFTDWDNDEQFFTYSDSFTGNPSLVAFNEQGEYITEYISTDSSEDMEGSWEYIFETSIFLERGNHYISWETYYAENVEEISLNIDGVENIVIYADSYGTGWISQSAEIFIQEDGYFSIKAKQNISLEYTWGARNPKIYRGYEETKWIAVKRNTASNYSWDNDSLKYGEDYLSNIKVYGDDKYNLTEYSWWWTSTLSTLEPDSYEVVSGQKSLSVNYPTSSGVDILQLSPGDSFGIDIDWSIQDALQFNLYISDVNKLDTSFGTIFFGGGLSGKSRFYYSWNISNINLSTGWNDVAVVFKDADVFYSNDDDENSLYLEHLLNLRLNNEELSNLYIMYKGVGESFTMKLDTFQIKRNKFYTDLKFDKGLCLTGHDSLTIPLSSIMIDKGSIEFWFKPGTDTLGMDYFSDMYTNTLFTLTNNNNDLLALRIQPATGFEVITGNVRQQASHTSALSDKEYIARDELVHIALVWSNDGSNMDNDDTLRLYLNNKLEFTSNALWDISDTKLSFLKLGGGVSQTTGIQTNFTNFIIGNIKIYNYCKDSFNLEQKGSESEINYTPENFIEISSDNVNFYGIGSDNLPLIFEQVPAGDKVTIYIRANKDGRFSNKNTTAQIVADWLITV